MAFPYSSSPSLQPQPCCCGSVQSWASNFAARTTTRLPGMEAYAAFCCPLDVYWGSLRGSLSFPEVGGDKLTTQIVSHCGLDFSEKIMNPPPFLLCLDKDWKQPHSSTQHGLPCAPPPKPFSAPCTTGDPSQGPRFSQLPGVCFTLVYQSRVWDESEVRSESRAHLLRPAFLHLFAYSLFLWTWCSYII